MENIRVYLICLSDLSESQDVHDLSDEQWIKISEEQGLVYSLTGFAEQFNAEMINEIDTVMRFINVYSIVR